MRSGAATLAFVADETLENLRLPTQVGQIKVAGSISTSPECGGWPRRCWRYELRRQGSRLPNWLRKCAS